MGVCGKASNTYGRPHLPLQKDEQGVGLDGLLKCVLAVSYGRRTREDSEDMERYHALVVFAKHGD